MLSSSSQQRDLSQPLWVPPAAAAAAAADGGVCSAADDLSFPDLSVDLVCFTGTKVPPGYDGFLAKLVNALSEWLYPSHRCPEWLDELPPASQLVHRIDELSASEQAGPVGLRPLDATLPQLLFESPSLPYLDAVQYALLVERYNEAAKGPPGGRWLLWVVLVTVCAMLVQLAVGFAYAFFRAVWVLAAGLPLAAVCFILSVGLLCRHARYLRQRILRRVLAVLRAANKQLDSRYNEHAVAVASGAEEGQRRVRRSQWRWVELSTASTLCLVLVDEPQPRDGMTLDMPL